MGALDRILSIAAVSVSVILMVGAPLFLRGWWRKLSSAALGIAVLGTTIFLGYPGYRRRLDDIRVANVNSFYLLVQRFKEKTGRCPLERRFTGAPMGVNITKAQLPERYRRPPPGAPGSIVPYDEFAAELCAELGRVDLPLDPQKVPFGPPNFYQYHFTGSHFAIAASLWFDRPGVKQLGPHYYKYELHGSCGAADGH